MSDQSLVRPAAESLVDVGNVPLSTALGRITLEVKGLAPDITHGTEFYTPIVTLLARQMNTRRQDIVLRKWPLLGCPFGYYADSLQQATVESMIGHLVRTNHMPVLWEIIDLFQSAAKWKLENIIKFVSAVETETGRQIGLMTALQAAADAAVKKHDAEGMRENEPQFNEGIVIPVDGPGRIN